MYTVTAITLKEIEEKSSKIIPADKQEAYCQLIKFLIDDGFPATDDLSDSTKEMINDFANIMSKKLHKAVIVYLLEAFSSELM